MVCNRKTNCPSENGLLTDQVLVVRKVDNAIHQINHYPVDSVVCFVNTYPLDSVIQPLNNRGPEELHSFTLFICNKKQIEVKDYHGHCYYVTTTPHRCPHLYLSS